MIVKVRYSQSDNKIFITSKPAHSGRDRQHAVSIDFEPSEAILRKLAGKPVAYFHAHLKEDSLVLDDRIDDQQW